MDSRYLARTEYWLTINAGVGYISSPCHVLLKQARFIVGDGFRILKRGFDGLILKLWMLP